MQNLWASPELFGLTVLRMMTAARTILFQLHPRRIVAPILLGGIVVLFTLSTRQRNGQSNRLCLFCHLSPSQLRDGAHEGIRTLDPTLTKGVLYRLSYVGIQWAGQDSNLRRLSQRIYSPPPLPLGTPTLIILSSRRWELNPHTSAYKADALPVEPRRHRRIIPHLPTRSRHPPSLPKHKYTATLDSCQ